MDTLDPQWRKSSRSGGNGGACVEVGQLGGSVLVRDSNTADSPEVPFDYAAWAAFLAALK
jgi:hypothetical protein